MSGGHRQQADSVPGVQLPPQVYQSRSGDRQLDIAAASKLSVCSMRIVGVILLNFVGANDLAAEVNELCVMGVEFDVKQNSTVLGVDAVYLNILACSF